MIRGIAEKNIEIRLTAEEDWLTINTAMTAGQFSKLKSAVDTGNFGNIGSTLSTSYFLAEDILYMFLPISEVPIVPFNMDKHNAAFQTIFPVMQVLFGPKIDLNEKVFKDLKFSDSNIIVNVGSINSSEQFTPNMDGLQKLVLQNDTGAVDADKVFDPFTAYPNKGKGLYIGSNEVF